MTHTWDMTPIRLGTNIKALLRQRSMTLREVSARAGIPYSTLHTWLDNRQPRDLVKVKRLAAFFGVSLHFLLFGEDEKHASLGADLPKMGAEGLVGVYEVIIRRKE